MQVNPILVNELRTLFKAGATVSALIRSITERHGCDARIDALVRDYFREAFHVPMLRIGGEQIRQIAEGGSLPGLNVAVIHRLIQTRGDWDRTGNQAADCWLDGVTATDDAVLNESTKPESIPELANSWERMDDEAKEYIKRIIGNSHALLERANALAALAEQLQEQDSGAVERIDRVA